MYVEERLAQLESVTNGHGKQIEMVADGLASLTNRVDLGFKEVRKEFERVDRRFEQIDQRFEQIDQRFDALDRRMDELKVLEEGLQDRVGRIETKLAERFDRIDHGFVQFHEVLTELVTLVKNKL